MPGSDLPQRPAIAVLMASYNGAANIRAQLESFASQSLLPALVLVSDDGSTDGTLALLQDFAATHPALPVKILQGPRQGASENFLHLLRSVPPEIEMIAFSDQDDVWLPEKLQRAADGLSVLPAGQVGLILGTSLVCDEDLGRPRRSPIPRRPAGFCHALVQNIAGGNTMVANRAGVALLQACAADLLAAQARVVVHDWWVYQIVTGCGGTVIFDSEPGLLYRQHPGNLIGANDGFRAKILRLKMMVLGGFREWNAINIRALGASHHRLTRENREILDGFIRLRSSGLLGRLSLLSKLGLYRQGLQGRLSLWLAAVLGKI